jgi:hypothetical protein
MNLERQLNNLKSVSDEDCCSLLAEVTERANEVVPVQHRQRIIQRSDVVSLAHLEFAVVAA